MINPEINDKIRAIKIVVFDIDGTLVAHQKTWNRILHEKHQRAIKLLKNQGYIVVLASARSMLTIDRLNNYADYFIGANGSFIYDCKANKIIFENVIAGADINKLLNLCDFNQQVITIYTRKQIYSNALTIQPNHYVLKPFAKWLLAINQYQNQAADLVVIESANCDENEQLINLLAPVINDINVNIRIQTKQAKAIMVANRAVNKLSSIKILCDLLGYSLANVMAFGDSKNDIEMLSGCAIGIVMKNASKKMYQHGDLISIASAKDGGIYDTLMRLGVINDKRFKYDNVR